MTPAARPSLLILVTLLACAAPAQAATVAVVEQQTDAGTEVELHYRAAPGEVNRLTIAGNRTTVTLRDTGATITAGRKCTRQADGGATCDISDAETATIELGDGDDEARLTSSDVQFGGTAIHGGAGNDMLVGGVGSDDLDGGGGRDVLRGNGRDDTLHDGDGAAGKLDADILDGGAGSDTVHYDDRRTAPVVVDLQLGTGPDGDVLAGVEGIVGTDFADDLRGTAGKDEINGGEGDDHIEGRGGDDKLIGSAGDDVLLGGAGDDEVEADLGRDIVDLGPGNDRFDTGQRDDALDRVTCGAGRDSIATATYSDRYAMDCEFLKDYSAGFPAPGGAELAARPPMLSRGTVRFRAVCPPKGCTARLELYAYRRGRRHGRLLGRSASHKLPGKAGRVLTVRIRDASLKRLRGHKVRVEAVLARRAETVEFPVRVRF